MSDDHKTRTNKRMLEGVVLGGMCSVIAMDLAEVTLHFLDPVAKKCHKYLSGNKEDESKAAQVHMMMESTPINQPIASAVDKEKEKKKQRRNIMKRVLRVLLLSLAVYLVASYVVRL